MFQGAYPYHIDDKGRLKIPAEFVSELGGEFTVTRGHNGCLWAMPAAEWAGMVARLQTTAIVDQRALTLQRYFIGSAVTLSLDGHGRLTLPPVLRDLAGIQHEVTLLGIGSKIEIWARERLAEHEAKISDALIEDLARSAGL